MMFKHCYHCQYYKKFFEGYLLKIKCSKQHFVIYPKEDLFCNPKKRQIKKNDYLTSVDAFRYALPCEDFKPKRHYIISKVLVTEDKVTICTIGQTKTIGIGSRTYRDLLPDDPILEWAKEYDI